MHLENGSVVADGAGNGEQVNHSLPPRLAPYYRSKRDAAPLHGFKVDPADYHHMFLKPKTEIATAHCGSLSPHT